MVRIIGAGMAGLLAGAMFRGDSQIYESAPGLPNNHHALLRFRTSEIADHLNIPFQAVDVIKIVKPHINKIAETICYSIKSNGTASIRSSHTANGSVSRRFIAPPDFIQRLAALQTEPINFGSNIDDKAWFGEGITISTIPMPGLMDLLGYGHRSPFGYRHGWVIKATIDVPSDICATIYFPDPATPIVRATLTGSEMQVELIESYSPSIHQSVDVLMERVVLPEFGLIDISYSAELVAQKYAKITPIPERERRKFIMWATDNFNVYSLGRFAIWKPGLLLDDVYQDIIRIQKMIGNGGSNYEGKLK